MARPTLLVTPFASALCPPAESAALRERLLARLSRSELEPLVPTGRGDGSQAAAAALILTGGTEQLALPWFERRAAPLLVLAHPSHNSLPAALEIVARLGQLGRRARLFLLRDDGADLEPLRHCARAVAAREALRGQKLGLVGGPSDWLVASTVDPSVLGARWGVELVTLGLGELRADLARADEKLAREVAADWRAHAAAVLEPSDDDLLRAARLVVALRALVARHGLRACALRCFDLLVADHTTGCLGLSQLIDDGVVAGCEGDVPATLTMMWLAALTGELPFMANPQDVSVAEQTIWLAHCTIARGLAARYRLRSHFESSSGVGIEASLAAPAATLARIGGDALTELTVVEGDVENVEPSPTRCRTQLGLRVAERSRGWLDRLLAAPLGNHLVLVPGRHESLVREYARMQPELRVAE